MNDKIREALLKPAHDGLVGITVQWPNVIVKPVAGEDWVSVAILASPAVVATLGPQGLNEVSGILQISCHTPEGQGEGRLRKTIAKVLLCYSNRATLTAGTQSVLVLSVSERTGAAKDQFYTVPIEIRWKAFIPS